MKRQLSLDVLRGVAVLLVIFHHFPCDSPILRVLQNGGWVGVDLFFVLSGFLVSGLLFKQHQQEGRIRPINFLIRRGFKIYPAFWVFLAVSAALFAFVQVDDYWWKFWAEALFVQNYTYNGGRFWRHTWSLAVEEHFYILLPLLLLAIQHDRFRSLPRIVLAVCVGVFACKCINYFRPFDFATHYTPTHLRIDALFFGTLLAYWHHYWPDFTACCKQRSTTLLCCGVMLLMPAFLKDIHYNPLCTSVWMTALYLGSGMILMSLVAGGVPTNFATRGLGFVGKYSYSIYLWHVVVIDIVVPMFGIESSLGVWTAQVLSITLGAVLSQLIETPMLWVRDCLTAPRRVTQEACA
jgi:peptidoglycan/LPS O-acetylase OafA/YrhL